MILCLLAVTHRVFYLNSDFAVLSLSAPGAFMQGLATWQARARGRDTPRSFNAPRSLPTSPVTISDNSDLLESLRKERTAWSLERDTLQNTILANQKALEEERLRRSACPR